MEPNGGGGIFFLNMLMDEWEIEILTVLKANAFGTNYL